MGTLLSRFHDDRVDNFRSLGWGWGRMRVRAGSWWRSFGHGPQRPNSPTVCAVHKLWSRRRNLKFRLFVWSLYVGRNFDFSFEKSKGTSIITYWWSLRKSKWPPIGYYRSKTSIFEVGGNRLLSKLHRLWSLRFFDFSIFFSIGIGYPCWPARMTSPPFK
jgi:hypothetical protein